MWARCGGTGIVLVDGGGGDGDGDGGESKSKTETESEAITPSDGSDRAETTNIDSAIRKLRLRTGAARTVIKVGGGAGTWIRGRNRLVGNLDLGTKAVYVCEGGVCKVVGLEDL